MSTLVLSLLKISRIRTVPYFVPELSEKFSFTARKALKLNWIDGAGRGNRTPMELLPTDFEFPENTEIKAN
jgi:hypothetical protein